MKTRQIVDGKHWCYKCEKWKELTEFYEDKKAAVGLRGRCKTCDMEIINSRHTNNLDRALRNCLIRHKGNGRNGTERRKAFTNEGCVSIEVLRELWQQQLGKCAVTGVELTHIQGKGFRVWTNVTIDRIDNDKGYVRDNIRLVCKAVNKMKNAMSDAELLHWASLILSGPLIRQLSRDIG